MEIEKECPICGNHFIAKRKSHVCCSRKCREEYKRLNSKKKCLVCGKEFVPEKTSSFCSKECKH